MCCAASAVDWLYFCSRLAVSAVPKVLLTLSKKTRVRDPMIAAHMASSMAFSSLTHQFLLVESEIVSACAPA